MEKDQINSTGFSLFRCFTCQSFSRIIMDGQHCTLSLVTCQAGSCVVHLAILPVQYCSLSCLLQERGRTSMLSPLSAEVIAIVSPVVQCSSGCSTQSLGYLHCGKNTIKTGLDTKWTQVLSSFLTLFILLLE